MNKNDRTVVSATDYHKVDGRLAPNSKTKALTLGLRAGAELKQNEIIAQLWQENSAEELTVSGELPFHQVLDLAILSLQSLAYFREAYRFPKLYNPQNPLIKRVGLQGDAMTVGVCTDNPTIDDDIASFSQELNHQGELLGERLRALARLMKELEN